MHCCMSSCANNDIMHCRLEHVQRMAKEKEVELANVYSEIDLLKVCCRPANLLYLSFTQCLKFRLIESVMACCANFV
jgi:hypothetical protein